MVFEVLPDGPAIDLEKVIGLDWVDRAIVVYFDNGLIMKSEVAFDVDPRRTFEVYHQMADAWKAHRAKEDEETGRQRPRRTL